VSTLSSRALPFTFSSAAGLAALLSLTIVSCDSEPATGGSDMCGDLRPVSLVYYGTQSPSYVPLRPGQVLAIGAIGDDGGVFCSGTLIAASWVITATHCNVQPGHYFCVGAEPENPSSCFQIVQTIAHPALDLTLAELGVEPASVLPEIEPVPIVTEEIDQSWVGHTAEGAGYGMTETGSSGVRLFTAEPIVQVDSSFVYIDGQQERGLCFGDSGGPLIGIASDGTVRVIGSLTGGDASCVQVDYYSRLDTSREWIESYAGPTAAGGSCGSIDGAGRCFGDAAVYCSDSALTRDDCNGGLCGWDDSAGGYRCISGDDPCAGVDSFGGCDGNIARWCEDGALRERDCGCEYSKRCELSVEAGGAFCADDPCMGIDFLGECRGDVVVWCSGGTLSQVDCAAQQQSCEFIDEDFGYYCQ
jgi:hypothetical protein